VPKSKSNGKHNGSIAEDSLEEARQAREAARIRDNKARFLKHFAHLKIAAYAARRIGVDRRTIYKWAADDEEFREAFLNMREEHTDALEGELLKLATGKYKKPLVSAGELVAFEDIHDVHALEMLLKAYRPRLYRDRSNLQITGADGGSVKIERRERKEVVVLIADAARLLAGAGVADVAGLAGQSLGAALALAEASSVPEPPTP